MFRALGDRTRYAIYSEVASSPVPLSTSDIAEVLDLHPNTVRPHLERLREVGLLDVESASQGSVGRPQHRYMLTDGAPSLGLEPPAYPLLADLLAQLAAELRPGDDDVAEVGRTWGRHETEGSRGSEEEPGAAGVSEDNPCVAALVDELAALPPLALRTAKATIDLASESSREAAILMEQLAYGMLAQTPDAQDAATAFSKKR